MATFTCPGEEYSPDAEGGDYMADGRVFKEHCRRLRQWFTYREYYGFWFLEFQARGAPHLHLVFNSKMDEKTILSLKKYWNKLIGAKCPHHKTRGVQVEVLRNPESRSNYAAKYSAKSDQKEVPENYRNVGRFWGRFGKVPELEHHVYQAEIHELNTINRVARRYVKARARDKNYAIKKSIGTGVAGANYFYCSHIILQYLKSVYIVPENLARISLRSHRTRTLVYADPESVPTSVSHALQQTPLQIRTQSYEPLTYKFP